MSDFVSRLGDALTEAAERQAARAGGWRARRDRLFLRLPRRTSTRALVLIGAVGFAGAGGTAGLLAGRGEVGGPPSLTFARVSPQQRAEGIRPLTRPVVFGRGRLAFDRRPWQLVGFQTTRGLCIEIDFPEQERAGGCGSEKPRGGRPLDWQAQIALAKLTRGLIVGAVDPMAASVRIRSDGGRDQATDPLVHARVIHVRERRLLAAMGLRRPFAYYVADLGAGVSAHFHADARDAHGALLGRIGFPQLMSGTSSGIAFRGHACRGRRLDPDAEPRLVSTMPPASFRSRLAVLRRPQRPSDLPPRSYMSLPFVATVEVDAIRRLGTAPDGSGLYLIPTTGRAFDFVPPPRCLRTLTPHQRERETMLQARMRRNLTALSMTVWAIGPRGGGTVDRFDLERVRTGKLRPGFFGSLVARMVPDGVASVDVRFTGGLRRTVGVQDNIWALRLPAGRPRPRQFEELWRDERGRVIHRLRW